MASEADTLLVVSAIEDVVAESNLQSGGTEPCISVLTLLEVLGIAIPFIVVLLRVGVRVYGAAPLVRVVGGVEESGLQSEFQPPVFRASQRQDVADAESCTIAFAFPSAFLSETYIIYECVRISTEEEPFEGCSLAGVPFVDVSAAQVVAGVQLIVAQLEILMLVVVLPPWSVEACTIGEVSVLGVIL